jgi:hypothetical protein
LLVAIVRPQTGFMRRGKSLRGRRLQREPIRPAR